MIVYTVLIAGLIVSGLFIGVGMRMIYMSSIDRLSGFNPRDEKVIEIQSAVRRYGGADRVENGGKTGIQFFLPVFILCAFGLLIRLLVH